MNAETGPRERAARPRRPGPQPTWIGWLPKDPSQIIPVYDESLPENPDNKYLLTLIKPAARTKRRSATEDEIETIDAKKIYEKDILDAETWLEDTNRYIDDREGESKPSEALQALITQLNDATKRLSPALALARNRPKPQSEILEQTQS